MIENTTTIRHATIADVQAIIHIANATWPITYGHIISAEQLQYMLQAFYNTATITQQLQDAQQYFFMAEMQNSVVGYAHIIPYDNAPRTFKLSKLYVLPTAQGHRVGQQLLLHCENFLKAHHIQSLVLNVNRYNTAVEFYKKMDYQIIETLDIPLQQFWLNDYILKKEL
jgi:diamine N-acetyltransferase